MKKQLRCFFIMLSLSGCVLSGPGLSSPAEDQTEPLARQFAPNVDLPDSEGRDLVLRACTKCHELGGLSAYRGYWDRAQWKEMVIGMVKNGAELKTAEQEIVTDYLTRHFGPGTRE